jgi:glycosyltransferase involved in cell wall biosynthesis
MAREQRHVLGQATTPMPAAGPPPRIAVLVPCYNEAHSIAEVVEQFKLALPTATIYVYDNNSTDGTKEQAAGAGAIVRTETFQGKGNVVRRMFADIEAEVYVLVDGDGTYDASCANVLVEHLLNNSLDMVNAARVPVTAAAYRPGHVFGNKMLTGAVAMIFGDRLTDML